MVFFIFIVLWLIIICFFPKVRKRREKVMSDKEYWEKRASSYPVKEYDRIDSVKLLANFSKEKHLYYTGKEAILISGNERIGGIEVNIPFCEDRKRLEKRIEIAESLIKDLMRLDNLTQDRLEELSKLPGQGYNEWQCDLSYIDIDEVEPRLVYNSRSIATEWVTIMTLKGGCWQIKNF